MTTRFSQYIEEAQWKDLFRYVLGRCFGQPEEAEDFTQEILFRLLQDGSLERMRRDAVNDAHFMALLKNAARWHLIDAHRSGQAKKRRAWTQRVSLDDPDHFIRPESAPIDNGRYECVERVIDEGEKILQEEYRMRGNEDLFCCLKNWLVPDSEAVCYNHLAAKTGQSPGAVKVALHRARKRYREIVRKGLMLPMPCEHRLLAG